MIAAPPATTSRRKIALSDAFIWILLVCLLFFGAFSSSTFTTGRNLRNVFLIQPMGLGVASLAQALVVISGGIDMSIGASVSLLTTMVAGLYKSHPQISPVAVVAVILLAGAAIGLLNALFAVILRIPAFMATLATMLILQGTLYSYTMKPIGGIPKTFRALAETRLLGIPTGFLIFLAVFGIVSLILYRHRYGKLLYAVGSDREVCLLSGIPVDKVRLAAYVASGVLVGVAALLLAARMGGGGPTAGANYELDTITVVVMGGVSLAGGRGGTFGIVGGVLTLSIFSNVMNLLDINPYVQTFLKGLILILAVSFSSVKKKKNLS